MKISKKVCIMGMILSMAISCNSQAADIQVPVDNQSTYKGQYIVKEKRGQINLFELNIGVGNDDELFYSPKRKKGVKTKKGIQAEKELTSFIELCPEVEEYIVNQIDKHEDVAAIGYTTVDVILNDEGEIVPVVEAEANLSTLGSTKYPEAKLLKTERGDTSSRGTCTLYTTVYKGSYDSSTKKYNFSTHSKVAWSEPVWMGGSNYHGSGWDYLLQTLPSTFTINSDTLECNWWHTDGVADSWWYSSSYGDGKVWTSRGNGKSNYVQWNIKDEAQWDALGFCTALADANLTVTSRGPASKNDRLIRSYYVHTWDSVTLNVEVSASTSKECILNLSPSSESKSWKLYSYVTFNDSTFK